MVRREHLVDSEKLVYLFQLSERSSFCWLASVLTGWFSHYTIINSFDHVSKFVSIVSTIRSVMVSSSKSSATSGASSKSSNASSKVGSSIEGSSAASQSGPKGGVSQSGSKSGSTAGDSETTERTILSETFILHPLQNLFIKMMSFLE